MPSRTPLHRYDHRALLVALVLVVIWGGNFTLQKYLFGLISPGGFLWARYLIMPVCALFLMRWRFGRCLPPLPRKDWMHMAWLGFIGHSLHVGLVTYGIHWSTAFSSSVILACGPIFTLLILRVQGLERLSLPQMAGVTLAFGGVLVFLSDKLLGGHWRAGGGDLVLLIAAGLFSYYTVAVKPVMQRHGPVLTMGYATLLGGLPVMLLSVPAGLEANWSSLDFWAWVGLLWSVMVSAFIGWLAWGWINNVRGVARTAPLMYLMPPMAGLFAWALSGEHYTWVKIAGAGVTLLGVALAQFAGQIKWRLR
ncbi:DMT family transporter [Limnohabitans sp.]|jgi:drug/metabolite transporter (DMT)-like permease|uniref:DMT family transporter n=1 Tax=Limnohabitans sp. TaxID=1907725 RepID=UPI001B71A40F|nr:DMT family transporter [Limnohabitans sp.]MBP6221411.1 DMT family transporter [Limnohabitans sp.]MBP6246244.1 DMT family transporter [Limnohabitans sp.]